MAKAHPQPSPKGIPEADRGPYTPRGFVARPGSFDAVVSGTVGKQERPEQDKPAKKPEAPRTKMDNSLDSLDDSLDGWGEINTNKQEQEQEAPARPPRIRPALLSSGYGSNAASKEEDFVIHGQPRCVAGTPVKLASEYENHPEWPWLRNFAGQEGKLVKQVGSGWGWVARFGKMEGTFRVRDGIHMLAYSKASTSHPPKKEPEPTSQEKKVEKSATPKAKTGVSKRVSIKDERRGSLIGSLDNATLRQIASHGRLKMHFSPIPKDNTKPQAESPGKGATAFRWGRVEGRKQSTIEPGVNPFELSATGPDRTIAFLMQKYHAREVAEVPTQESMYETQTPRRGSTAPSSGIYIDEDGQKVDVTSGSQPVRGRSFRSFPVAPYGGWQRQDRPSTARYTSRAPDLKSGVRLRPASAGNVPRPYSGTALSQPASARGGSGLLRLDLQKMYGRVETESRPSARKSQLFVIDGEPTCRPGAEVRVAPGYEWDALEMFRGHVGTLTRREAGKGWHVYFPALKEEAFFLTSAKQSMLVYNASDVEEIPQPHIFANQVKYSKARGQGPDAFTSSRFAYQCSTLLSFREETQAESGQTATLEEQSRGR